MDDRLSDKESIRDRKAKYCRFLDTKQFDKWEGLFAPDARATFYGPDGATLLDMSITELSPLTRKLFASTRTVHQTHNSEIEFVSSNEARAIWAMEDWHVYTPTPENPSKFLHGYGFYDETWRLIGDEWVIARIELRRTILDRG